MQRCRRGTPSSHRTGQTGARQFEELGRPCGRGDKAETFSGNMTRQEDRGQAGSATDNRSEKYWKALHVKAKIQSM